MYDMKACYKKKLTQQHDLREKINQIFSQYSKCIRKSKVLVFKLFQLTKVT